MHRVREHEVEPAELGNTVGHNGFQPFEVTDVTRFGDDPATGLLDQVDGLVEVLAVDIG
ncbi:MAG: hypothetical protein U0792_09905 [Gemmataceae bacterium]